MTTFSTSHWSVKEHIRKGVLNSTEIADFDVSILLLSQIKLKLKDLIEHVHAIDMEGRVGAELAEKDEKELGEFTYWNDEAVGCYEELSQLEIDVKTLLGEGKMAPWFTAQAKFLKTTLEEGFFNAISALREEEMEGIRRARQYR